MSSDDAIPVVDAPAAIEQLPYFDLGLGIGASAGPRGDIDHQPAETDGVVVLANHNSSSQVAISGEVAAIEAACAALKEVGAKRAIRLNVSGAFHSPLLEGAAASFAQHLVDVPVDDPSAPLVANVSASPVTDGATLKDGFRRQLTMPVLWHDGLGVIASGSETGEAAQRNILR